MRRLFLLQTIILVISNSPSVISFQWEDEDSVIVEGVTASDLLKRRGGKFPFTWPWETHDFTGRGRSEYIGTDLTCYTTLGEEGICATLRQCYPMLYSLEYTKQSRDEDDPNLIDTLKSISGPCDMPNLSKFRVDMPDSLICCPSRIVYPEPGVPQFSPPTPTTSTEKSETSTLMTSGEDIAMPAGPVPVSSTTTERPTTLASIPDAVAAYYHREFTCGYINETNLKGMGEEEARNRFPWIVALVGSRGHFCAGSLLDRYTVLTSASCTSHMTSDDVTNLQVYLGDYKLHSVSDGPLIARKVARVIYHRGFDNQTLKNDIALLRFKLPAPVGTPRVLPICRPKRTFKRRRAELKENMLVGVEATLAGWGRTWSPSPVPVLHSTKMKIWSNEKCRLKYGYLARSGITDHMLCAYPPRVDEYPSVEGDMDTDMVEKSGKGNEKVQKTGKDKLVKKPVPIQDCIGDTGGPLVILNEEKKYEQVGIVSWNIGCSHYPYIHTRVSSYLNWIEKNMHR